MSRDVLKNINMEYIDGIVIVDDTGKILYSLRYNPRFDKYSRETEFKNVINKNFLEIYPSITPENSTIVQCLKKGIPIYKKLQKFHDYKGRLITTRNLTIPIIRSGKVVGAIELIKDITTIQDVAEDQALLGDSEKSVKTGMKNHSVLKYSFDHIITKNSHMLENIRKARLIAESPSSVLVYGETGTGKELFVQSIHNESSRRNKPFIAQNCAALPETLFESILFGTVKGAFTGASEKKGLFELADGGTLFLDEINSMSLNLQAKLLRVLQDGCVRRIGDVKDRKVNVRIIAAMNVDPMEAIEKCQIRDDIFYRLSVTSIRLVPLRDRKEDILLLVEYFINKYNEILKGSIEGISEEVETLFSVYKWPGNVRELEHIIEGAMNIVRKGKIEIKHLPIYLSSTLESAGCYEEEIESIEALNDAVAAMEVRMITKAVRKAGGNVSKAAKILKIPRQTLRYKIKKYNIHIE